jgi:hypothetical protein
MILKTWRSRPVRVELAFRPASESLTFIISSEL